MGTFAQDLRGSSTCLKLRLGALETAAALIIGVLATLTAGRGRGTLQWWSGSVGTRSTWGYDTYTVLASGYQQTAETGVTWPGQIDVQQRCHRQERCHNRDHGAAVAAVLCNYAADSLTPIPTTNNS